MSRMSELVLERNTLKEHLLIKHCMTPVTIMFIHHMHYQSFAIVMHYLAWILPDQQYTVLQYTV